LRSNRSLTGSTSARRPPDAFRFWALGVMLLVGMSASSAGRTLPCTDCEVAHETREPVPVTRLIATGSIGEPAELASLRSDQSRTATELLAEARRLHAAAAADDRAYRAWAERAIAQLEYEAGNPEAALAAIERALDDTLAPALRELRFELLTTKLLVLLDHGRFAETEAMLHAMQEMIAVADDLRWRMQWLHGRGVLERKLGHFAEAKASFLQARDLALQLGDDAAIARELNSIGMIDGRTGRFSDAVTRHNEALALARGVSDKDEVARSLRMLGILYRNLDDEERASEYLREALAQVEERNQREAIVLHEELSAALSRLDRFAEAEHHAQRSLELAEVSGSPQNKVYAFIRMAELKLAQNRPEQAEELIERGFKLFNAVASRDRIQLRLVRIRVWALRGRGADALKEAADVVAETRRVDDRILERAALDLLAEQQLRTGDAASAFFTRKAHKQLDKEPEIDMAARRIAVLEADLADQRRGAERQLLARDNAIQALDLNRQRLLGSLLFFALLVTLAGALLLYSRYRSVDRMRTEADAGRDEIARLHRTLLDNTAELERVAHTDALTGLANRRSIVRSLQEALDERDRAVSVILLDLDHFKQINDRHGHLAGDAVLRDVAVRLREALPTDASVGRWGGEEFIVLMQTERADRVAGMAEALRQRLSVRPVTFDGVDLAISASLGVATTSLARELDTLLAAADVALYRAKHRGRNCVEIAGRLEEDGTARTGASARRAARASEPRAES
jgi:diguanylate cyclase (GGDEF)-like protein